jgi:hypothetical protein
MMTTCNKARKLGEGFEHQESGKMRGQDELSRAWNVAMAAKADLAVARSTAALTVVRPEPKFKMGQSVFHFWASWMHTAKEPPLSISGKKQRGKWYSASISSPPQWLGPDARYGGQPVSGWGYVAH